MRNLKVLTSGNLAGCKEYNQLRISNINDFFSECCMTFDFYTPQFKVLSELEKRVMFENKPEDCILIEYKLGGDMIFRFVEIIEEGDLRVVVYRFEGSIS